MNRLKLKIKMRDLKSPKNQMVGIERRLSAKQKNFLKLKKTGILV